MKQAISTPVAIGAVVVAVVAVALFFVKGAMAEPHTPRPDPAMFGYARGAASNKTAPPSTP